VTNVPAKILSVPEAAVLYRARWQVELLFKRWKSQGCIAQLQGSTAVRQLVRVWSRLIGVVVQHWLVVAVAWGDPTRSLSKMSEAVCFFVGRILAALNRQRGLRRTLQDLDRALSKTCRRNKRKKPGTFELLNDPAQCDFLLT
jgi:hypothetical protein